MTTFVEALFANLSTLGTAAGTRIYPIRLPEKVTLPAVTYQQVSAPKYHTQSGPSSVHSPRFQLNCWAETYLAAEQLAQEFVLALDGYQGNMSGHTVHAGFVEEEGRDDVDADTGRFRKIVEIVIWHQ